MKRFVPSLQPGRRFVAGLLLAHVLAVLVLAASPSLHHRLHHDAGDDDHDCAVVLFQHGSADASPAPLAAMALAALLAVVLAPRGERAAFVPSVFAENRVFEHAPPLG